MAANTIGTTAATARAAFALDRLKTPIGTALLVTDRDGLLRALDWEDHARRMKELLRLHYGAVMLSDARAPREIRVALSGYFEGAIGLKRSDGALRARLSSARCGRRCRRFHRAGP